MNSVIVLETRGKHESVDYAAVHLFESVKTAMEFCANNNTGKTKHWKEFQIVSPGEVIELTQPEE